MDPLLPPRYKHRKVPRGPASPPPQVLRSPPRQLTQKDMEDWKVPPCISNWKNSNGYTIPLHMRLSADGRTLQHNTINEHFADIVDSLYIAERQARSELEERAKIQKSVQYK
jgi:SNW domain-containing protein 1